MNKNIFPVVIGGVSEKKCNKNTQWHQQDRIYDGRKVAISICTSFNPYYLVRKRKMENINMLGLLNIKGDEQVRRVYGTDGIYPTLNTMQGGNRQPKFLIKQATKKGYIECIIPSVVDLSYPESKTRRGRVQEQGKISPTLTTGNELSVIESEYAIRKLTPRECWKLMGFSDEDFDNASKVNSNTQLYKQAGNSIVVNVLEAIFTQLF